MKKKKNKSTDYVNEILDENPELREQLESLEPDEDGFLFSKELRDTLKPFGNMDIRDAIKSKDFMQALCRHAGMSDEKFNEILNSKN